MDLKLSYVSYDYDALIKELGQDVVEFGWRPKDTIYIDRDKPFRIVGYLEYRPIIDYRCLLSGETVDDLKPKNAHWEKTTLAELMQELSEMNKTM